MPWYCGACGRRMGSPVCKKKCRDKWGDRGAERVPPLDGFMVMEVDPSIPEKEDMKVRAAWFEKKRQKETAGSKFWERKEE